MPAGGAPPTGLTVGLAGEFTVRRDGAELPPGAVGSRKARQLLKLLAVHRGSRVGVDRICAVLWGDAAPQRPAENVATLVSRLRGLLGADVVAGDRGGYRLGDGVVVDLDIAADHVAEARRRSAAGEPALALAAAIAAVDLLAAATALGEEPDADWAEPARIQLAQRLAAARRVGGQAAIDLGDFDTAVALGSLSIVDDPYDESAHLLVMRAEAAAGRGARALAHYERLRDQLADELGVDPGPALRELHLALLREETPVAPGGAEPVVAPGESALLGRDRELARLSALWNDAAAGRPSLVLLAGEAGIGKTRLATELAAIARRTGGTVLSARCYETERSLFLQPFVEALGQHAARTSGAVLRQLAGDGGPELALLIPELAGPYGSVTPPSQERLGPDIQLARVYRAVAQYVYRLAGQPVLLILDDLHQAGLSTVELLHYLVRQAGATRLMVLATIRAEEGAAALAALASVAHTVDLGPLPAEAVGELARAAGHGDLAASIVARTGGHAFFVVETLRALASGETGVPASLTAAVLARVRRSGRDVEDLLRGAAVLGAAIDPDLLARLLDITPSAAVARCEAALAARLLVVADRAYEFANDLLREVLYASLPEPTRVALHRRAADLLSTRPEALAPHAAAAGDTARAARAWLLAGEEAARRLAAADGDALLTYAVDAAEAAGDLEVVGRALLARGRLREIGSRFEAAQADITAAADVAHRAGDRRLEMLARHALGGDTQVALGLSIEDSQAHLRMGLQIAGTLGDRAAEAALLARLAIVSTNRLAFSDALDFAQRAVRVGRASGDERALMAALDGMKTVFAYLGEVQPLQIVLTELMPLLRNHGELQVLMWAVQEAGFIPLAAGDWDAALASFDEALEISRRVGARAFEGWFLAHTGWTHRLAGDLHLAVRAGRHALDLTADASHVWCRAAAGGFLAVTLIEQGRRDEAAELLATALGYATRDRGEAYLLRCLGAQALATGSHEIAEEGDRLLETVRMPAGAAWIPGVDAYLCLGRAFVEQGEPERAAAIVKPLAEAADRTGWIWVRDACAALTV
jgi:DNA-binding SARP family transcriptional activator